MFEWRIYLGHTTDQLLDEVQKMMNDDNMHPYNFKGRIIFMSMHNDTGWDQKHNEDGCKQIRRTYLVLPKCCQQDSAPTNLK